MDIELAQALKEIAELKAQIERNKIDLAISEHDREHNDYELTEVYKKVEQLEKENAELKNERNAFKMYSDGAELDAINLNEQLTKAKEIIRSLYFIIQGRIDYKGNIPLEDEMYRANQFLNSEVEK